MKGLRNDRRGAKVAALDDTRALVIYSNLSASGTLYAVNVWTENDGVNTWIAANGVYFNPKA